MKKEMPVIKKKDKIKIAIIHPNMSAKGGAENLILWMCDELTKLNHEVLLISSKFDQSINTVTKKYSLLEVPIDLKIKNWKSSVKIIIERISDFDIVNTHNFPATLFGWWIKRKLPNIQLVWYCHEPKDYYYGKSISQYESLFKRQWKYFRIDKIQDVITIKLDRKAVTKHGLILCNSKRTASFVRYIYDINNVHTLYPAVDIEGISDINAEYIKNKFTNSKNILVVSRLEAVKNIITAIEVLRRLLIIDPEYKLVVLGEGSYKSELIKYCINKKITNNVSFKGYVSNEELRQYYLESFVTLNLSINEPFGLTSIESIACGTPSILSDDSGASETINDGVNGIIVDHYDIDGIFQKIVELKNNFALYMEIINNGKKLVNENFTIEQFTKKFLRFVSRGT